MVTMFGRKPRRLLGPLVASIVLAGVAVASPAALSSQDPRDEQRAINAADQQLARSLVVRPVDMPGWKAFGLYPKGGGGTGCPKFNPDFSDFTITGDQRGRQFMRRNSKIDEVLSSSAEVYETEDDTLGEWRIWTSAASVACLRKLLQESAPSGSLTVSAEAAPLKLPRVAPRQFARRYLVIWVANNQFTAVYFDDIYLVRGRAAVSLIVQRVGSPDVRPTASVERRLVMLLGKRLADAFP